MSIQETAKILHVSPATIEREQAAAIKKLRPKLRQVMKETGTEEEETIAVLLLLLTLS